MNKLFKTYGGSLLLVAFLFVSIGAQSQAKYMLKGVVSTLENNELLPGSSILVKGTTRGTATDFDGNFAIEVSEGEKIIVSFVGYDEQEIAITGQKSEEVKLKMSVGQSLSDVVVVGYGVQKRSHLTGSVSKMDDANFAEAPVSRADQALVGKLSGVDIATTDASAGASPKILIRGVSSINTSTDPLIVVDGFPIPGDLSSVDMNDVQSIEVLKDAASAAIYGSRGANGVIMITTKSGKKGKLSFDVNVISGVKSAFKRDDLYSTPSEWVDKLNAQGIPLNTQVNKMMELGTATDWQDVIFRTGGFQKYQVGASGGGEWGNFYFGGSYQSDKGVVLTDQFDKFSLRGNINAKLSERVEAGIQISGSSSKSRVVAVGLQDALRNQPWLPLYHTEQTLAFLAANNLPLTSPNYGSVLGRPIQVGDVAHESDFGTSLLQLTNNNSAYAKVMDRDNSYRNIEMYANAYVKINILPGLNLKSTLGTYYSSNQREWFQSSTGIRTGISGIESNFTNSQQTSLLNENTLDYSTRIGDHDISALAGFTYQDEGAKSLSMNGSQYSNDLIHTLNAAGAVTLGGQSESQNRLISALARVNYSYKDRYLVSVSARSDGSSRFGKSSRWGSFPSVSLGWRVSEEEFMKGIEVISALKLRATYGATGNNSLPDYLTISTLTPVNAVMGSVRNGYAASNISNPDLGWERTVETNLGFDLGLVQNRFNLSMNYYFTTKDQLLLQLPVPAVTGFDVAWKNVGQLKTSGIELDFNSVNIAKGDFTWKTSLNISHNSNELVDFGGVEQLIVTPDSKRPTQWVVQVGGPLSQFYGYEVDRELTASEMLTPAYPIGVTAERAYAKDQNNDGKITAADRVVLGDPYPDFTWGFTNEFKYKDFDLSVMLNGSQGAETANIDPYYFESQWKGGYNTTVTDPTALIVKPNTSFTIQDASYICLRNVSVGYTAPKSLANKFGMQNFRVYVAAQNLLYLMGSNYTSFNPEAQNLFTDNPLTPGAQRGGMPITRTVSIGLSLGF